MRRLILSLSSVVLGLCCSLVAAPPSKPSLSTSSAISPQNSHLVRVTLERLTKVEESLMDIKKSLTTLQEIKKEATSPKKNETQFNTWRSAQRHLDYLDNLLRRGATSLTKLSSLSPRHLSAAQWLEIGGSFGKFIMSLLMGFLFFLLFTIIVNKTADNMDHWANKFSFNRLFHLLISIPLRFFPIFVCFVAQIVTFYILESSHEVRELIFSFGLGLFFLSVVWKCFSLLGISYPSDGRGRLSEATVSKRYAIFWTKGIAVAYVAEQWALILCEAIEIPWEGQRLILMLSRLVIFSLVFFLVQSLRHVLLFIIPREKYFIRMRARIPLVATGGQGSLFFLYGVWLFSERLFQRLLLLVLVSLALFVVFPFLNRRACRLHTGYLWKTRELRSSLVRIFIQRHVHPTYSLRTLVGMISLILVNAILEMNPWVWVQAVLGFSFVYRLFDVCVIFTVCWLLVYTGSRLLQYSLDHRIAASRSEYSLEEIEFRSGRLRLLGNIISGAFRMLVWICGFFLSVSALGYDIFPLLTGLGALSFSLGLGLQTFVRDIVAGFWVIYENTLVLGDSVEVDNHSGVVEEFGIRSFRLRTDNGAVLTIPFGSMITVSNKSRFFSYALFSVSVGYNENIDKIHYLIEKAGINLRKNPLYRKHILAPLEVRGITEVTDFSMVFSARVKTIPGFQDEIKRAYTQMLKRLFDEAGIRVPSPSVPGRLPSLINTPK